VSAIGRKSLNKTLPFFWGIGTYLVNFKISGNAPFLRRWFIISLGDSKTTSAIS